MYYVVLVYSTTVTVNRGPGNKKLLLASDAYISPHQLVDIVIAVVIVEVVLLQVV